MSICRRRIKIQQTSWLKKINLLFFLKLYIILKKFKSERLEILSSNREEMTQAYEAQLGWQCVFKPEDFQKSSGT